MDRLKPCPFCGSKDIKLFGNHRDSFWFRCNKCASIDSYDTERQAVRAWNKRVAIPSAEPCEDAISRDAVLEKAVYTETEEGWCGYTVDVDYIKSLPSVKPQEPSGDAVSRQWLMRKATEKFYTTNYFNHITKMIEEAPSVNPQPTGHWIRQNNTKEPLYGWYFCSECNSVIGDKTKFCSNCGCRMVEPQEISDHNLKMWKDIYEEEKRRESEDKE